MSWDRKAHQAIERELWEAVERTKAHYEDLRQEYVRMIDEARDIGLGHSDGSLASARSIIKHRELGSALAEFAHALKRFKDHVIVE